MKRAGCVAVAVLSTAALAYVMPGYSILKHLAETRDGLQLFTLRVDGSATFSGAGLKDVGPVLGLPTDRPELQADATLYLKLPRRCRMELSSVEGGKQVAAVTSAGKKRFEGSDLASVDLLLQEVCALLAERSASEGESRAAVERHLQHLGVKEDVTWLARFGGQGQVAFVLGEQGDGKAQLWVYKDSFEPARLRFVDAQGAAWDLRLLDYGSPATGEWFPRTVELYKAGELQVRFTALKADARGSLSDKLF